MLALRKFAIGNVPKQGTSTKSKVTRKPRVHANIRDFLTSSRTCAEQSVSQRRVQVLKIARLYSQSALATLPRPTDTNSAPLHRRPLNTAERDWLLERELANEALEDASRSYPKPRFDWRQRAFSRRVHDRGKKYRGMDEFRYVRRQKREESPMDRKFANEIEAYRKRFLPLIAFEQAVEERVVKDRLSSWSVERLKKEGYCLTDMHAFWLANTHLGRAVARFRMGPGIRLPQHCFTYGTRLLISKFDPLKEVPCGGNVVSSTPEQIDVALDEYPDVQEGHWRMDYAYSDISFERMRKAIHLLDEDPLTHERDPENSPNTEYIVQGTQLRNVLLRSFTPAELAAHEPHHMQDPSEKAYPSHAVLDHPISRTGSGGGAFKDDLRLRSWATRYALKNPVVAEGDPTVKGLNESQVRAAAIMIGERISLIQGPPGTGKTRTIIETVKLLKCHFEVPHPLLVCTYTNVASDNLLEGFAAAGLRPLRVGFEGNVKEHLKPHLMEQQFESHPKREQHEALAKKVKDCEDESRELNRRIIEMEKSGKTSEGYLQRIKNMEKALNELAERGKSLRAREYVLRQKMFRDIVMRADVICTTCISSASSALNVIDFPVVFLDEASMATEPASLIPLMKGCQHLALIGDHKQLPPVVSSREADEGGLSISLFERLNGERHVPSIMLDTQYRMHPKISQFPSSEFYDSTLLDGTVNASGHVSPELLPPVCSHLPVNPETGNRPSVMFVDHQGSDALKDRSRVNWTEAYIVCSIVEELLLHNPDLRGENIGVIAPYKSQIKLLTRLLTKDMKMRDHFDSILSKDRAIEIANVEIKTVDGFEGREKDVIIFSTVRNNRSGYIGFLADRRRLNVGLTRAKRALFIIGSMSTLEKGKFGRSSSEEMVSKEARQVHKGAVAWRRFMAYLTNEKLVTKIEDARLREWLTSGNSQPQTDILPHIHY